MRWDQQNLMELGYNLSGDAGGKMTTEDLRDALISLVEAVEELKARLDAVQQETWKERRE